MDIKDLKGVGPKTNNLLNKLNINTVNDLLEYYPFRFQIYDIVDINEVLNMIC